MAKATTKDEKTKSAQPRKSRTTSSASKKAVGRPRSNASDLAAFKRSVTTDLVKYQERQKRLEDYAYSIDQRVTRRARTQDVLIKTVKTMAFALVIYAVAIVILFAGQ